MKIVIGVVVVVLLAGGAWYVTTGSDATESAITSPQTGQAEQARPNDAVEEQSFSGLGSLDTLFSRGEQIKCNFTAEDEAGLSTGTFYTDGNRFSTVASHTYEGVLTETKMVNDGEFMYVWGETTEGSMAIKMRTPDVQDAEAISQPDSDSQEYIDFDEQVSYDCERWRVEASLFVPPANIEFTDMAAMMEEALQRMPEGFELPEGIEILQVQ